MCIVRACRAQCAAELVLLMHCVQKLVVYLQGYWEVPFATRLDCSDIGLGVPPPVGNESGLPKAMPTCQVTQWESATTSFLPPKPKDYCTTLPLVPLIYSEIRPLMTEI